MWQAFQVTIEPATRKLMLKPRAQARKSNAIPSMPLYHTPGRLMLLVDSALQHTTRATAAPMLTPSVTIHGGEQNNVPAIAHYLALCIEPGRSAMHVCSFVSL